MYMVHSIDGVVVSRQLCTNAYAFACILDRRIMQGVYNVDPFAWHTSVPLSQVKSRIAARS